MTTLRLSNPLQPQLEALAESMAPHLTARATSAGRFELACGPFAIAGDVKGGCVASLEVRLPIDLATAPAGEREAIARALHALGYGFSVRFAERDRALPALTDELALRAWLALPPPPTAAEAHDTVLGQLASGRAPDRELVARALGDARADELIAALAAGAPPAESVPRGTRDPALLLRVSADFDAYALVGPIGGYANRARRVFRECGAVPRTAAAARLCLFFEQRRRVHQAADPSDEDWRYYDALFEVIRGHP